MLNRALSQAPFFCWLIHVRALISGLVLGVFLTIVPAHASSAKAKLERVTVEAAGGVQVFQVEVVREERARNRGLMYRRHLATDHGMLFDYDPPVAVGFWMKNTYIPLDIIFIANDGKIIRIAENAVPFSLDHIPSGGKIRGVLEINGGLSAKLGIKVGDKVRHRLFNR